MSVLTPIEQSAIAAILGEAVEHRPGVQQQLNRSRVLSRENTGGGFFTALEVSTSADRLAPDVGPLGQNVYIGVCGLDYGLGLILHLREGYVNLLEGYSVGGEDTSAIDFAHVGFALIDWPGPIPKKVG